MAWFKRNNKGIQTPTEEKKDIPNLFPLSSARSMTDPLHRLKFGALSGYAAAWADA